jgi:polysaccharide export outer membrane protein
MKRVFPSTVFLLLALEILTGCKTQNLFEVNRMGQAASDSLFTKINNGNQYCIQKDDKINISVWNNDDVSVGSIYGIYNSNEGYGKWLMVDGAGEISVPQLGNVKVSGLTVAQVKHLIAGKFSVTIRQPVIDVKILNKEVSVLGEVKIPGKVHLEKENNILTDILASAGGFDTYGNKARVQVVRIVNDTPRTILLDMTQMSLYARNNIQILPNDVVYVTARKSKDFDKRAGAIIIPTASAITAIILILKTF